MSPVTVFFTWLISGVVIGILFLLALPYGHANSLPFYLAIAVGILGGAVHARRRARNERGDNAA